MTRENGPNTTYSLGDGETSTKESGSVSGTTADSGVRVEVVTSIPEGCSWSFDVSMSLVNLEDCRGTGLERRGRRNGGLLAFTVSVRIASVFSGSRC